MATREDVILAIELFHKNRPRRTLEKMNEMGIYAVLKFLNEAKVEVNSADICKHLEISSARVAVLIKKMQSKGLVLKSNSKSDARVKIVSLSEKGRMFAQRTKQHMYDNTEKVVDEFGIERLKSIFDDLSKIQAHFEKNLPQDMENLYEETI